MLYKRAHAVDLSVVLEESFKKLSFGKKKLQVFEKLGFLPSINGSCVCEVLVAKI